MAEPNDIKLIVLDVDGVLTDGTIIIDDHGVETKRFFVRDGMAITAAMRVGVKVGVLTARSSPCVTLRMKELNIEHYMHGIRNKGEGIESLCQRAGIDLEETAYLGDDLLDLRALSRCGYPMAVGDGVEEIREMARFITTESGGRGAVREAIEHILKAQGLWDEVLDHYGT
jgi:3-deoxy-D-manno-octulosonate 8-phosphate phosphatase (KDO 8-P phosphatase)